MTRARTAWLVFALAAGAAVGALALVTDAVLDLEAGEARARAEVELRDGVRRALWRADTWAAPLLAREVARAPFQLCWLAEERAGVREGGKVTLADSFDPPSPWFPVHFRLLPDGTLQSPEREPGEMPALDVAGIRARLAAAEARLPAVLPAPPAAPAPSADASPAASTDPGRGDYAERGQNFAQARQALANSAVDPEPAPFPGGTGELTGPLLPFWLGTPGEGRLVLARRVRWGPRAWSGGEEVHGFLVDWRRMTAALEAEAAAVLPGARIAAVAEDAGLADTTGRLLATLPAMVVPPALEAAGAAWSPGRTALALAWAAVLGAVATGAAALRSGLALADRRARFVAAVTHELRTPLTTFRMYSEMLARGMVEDPDRRQRYLETLEDEAERLSALVENVLAYARIEEGRGGARTVATTVADLAARLLPPLERRAARAGARLDFAVEGDPATPLRTDGDALGQVLLNLVDNACKYGLPATGGGVEVRLGATGGRLSARVRDGGPGVPRALRGRIFRPFDRGARDASDPAQGVGLGLALSRAVASTLGGTLEVDDAPGGGAEFRLDVPA